VTWLSPPRVVLFLLCLLYFLLFVNRVNLSTAAPLGKAEIHLSNTQLALVFSAFAIPCAVFQPVGGWIGDKLCAREAHKQIIRLAILKDHPDLATAGLAVARADRRPDAGRWHFRSPGS
jgi:MFS family permease